MPKPIHISDRTRCLDELLRGAVENMPGFLKLLIEAWSRAIDGIFRGQIRFRKYSVAPRLGTDAVRRRLLVGLHRHVRLTATETGLP